MNTFNHGDVIEYEVLGEWRKGTYVGHHPVKHDVHIFISDKGFVCERFSIKIRKPKQKKEGYIGIMKTRDTHNRWATGIRDTQKEIKELTDRMGSYLISIGKVEWEE